jgi:DNA-binding CsgD family transcriptional regulator
MLVEGKDRPGGYLARVREIEEPVGRSRSDATPADEASSRQRLAELHLSMREREVLQLIADGLGNREIAQQLFLSQETVKTHVSNVRTKLRARSRSHAVAIALRRDLIS